MIQNFTETNRFMLKEVQYFKLIICFEGEKGKGRGWKRKGEF